MKKGNRIFVLFTATALLMQTIFPIAAPTHCIEIANISGSPRTSAVLNCRFEKRFIETVAEPETKAPRTPIKGEIST